MHKFEIHFLRRETRVDQGKHPLQRGALAEIIAHGGVKFNAISFGNLGVTVAGEVDETPRVVDREKIDQLGFTRQIGNEGEIFFLGE